MTLPAPYLSSQTTLPVTASRQVITSSPATRPKVYSLSPARTGDETPVPISLLHFLVRSFGQDFGAVKPMILPSRLGPRHCGQSWARMPPALKSSAALANTPIARIVLAIATLLGMMTDAFML